jgi:hypothetical protein
MNLFGFVVEALAGSYTEEQVNSKLKQMGAHDWAAWVIASIGVAGFLKILKDHVLVEYTQVAIEVTFPNNQKRQFENSGEFQKWLSQQSKEYQAQCLECWTESSRLARKYSSAECHRNLTPWIRNIYQKKPT